MTRTFTFRNSKETYTCCPIVASNMDGVGTFSMAKVLQEYKMMTVITKTTTPEQWRTAVGQWYKIKILVYAQVQIKCLHDRCIRLY